VREIMSRHVGVLRDRAGLRAAIQALRRVAFSTGTAADAAAVGLMIATAALLREESRGGHFRTDFPHSSRGIGRLSLRLGVDDVVSLSVPAASPAIALGV
jgi:L-aspartate oxidase